MLEMIRSLGSGDTPIRVLALTCAMPFIFGMTEIIGRAVYTIYRLKAYDYKVERLSARVVDTEHKPSSLVGTAYRSAEYNVEIRTKNGLKAVINDKKLYEWAWEGRRLKVYMKIGRSRGKNPQIKYWRVLEYTYHWWG